jgi:hypothetical protein
MSVSKREFNIQSGATFCSRRSTGFHAWGLATLRIGLVFKTDALQAWTTLGRRAFLFDSIRFVDQTSSTDFDACKRDRA